MTKRTRIGRQADFTTQIGRIEAVGIAVYGEGWPAQIARGIAIGRSTIYRYLAGKRSTRNVDQALLKLLADERVASYGRANVIAGMERRLAGHVARVAEITERGR